MSLGLFKNVVNKMGLEIIYIYIEREREDLALNSLANNKQSE